MAGAVFADPIAARRAVLDLGGDFLKDVFDMRPRRRRTAGHDAWAMTRAFFATRNSGADVEQSLGLDIFGAANSVLEERIAAVNDNIAGFEQRQEVLDEFVHRRAGLD